MRVLVVIGTDFKGQIDYQRIADATQERYYLNQVPPVNAEGWLFWSNAKEPDWSWGDYVFVIGTVEAGRHEVTGHILATEDVQTYLIDAYDRFSGEFGEADEGESQ